MIRVVTGSEMAALDARAQADYGLPGLVLMENAGREVAVLVGARFGRAARVGIVCGPGNNGGDGLVAARHLFLGGQPVEVWLGAGDDAYRGDALVNLRVARALGLVLHAADDLEALRGALDSVDVVVDAFFGTGFRGEPRPAVAEVLRVINEAGRPVVAVDIPSGVEADTGHVRGEAVRASITVTFALPKLGSILYPGAAYTGELVVVPISLPDRMAAAGIERFLVEPGDVDAFLPRRPREAHKGMSGRVLVVGGSPGLSGAPFLAARGALRAGAGLVTALIPAGLSAVEKPPEVMTGALPADASGGFGLEAADALHPWLERADVLAVGPGLGGGDGAWAVLAALLETWSGPMVLDADALNLLAARGASADGKRRAWVMTPHPGEMARLIGKTAAEVEADRIGWTVRLAAAWNATAVLKGVPTVVAYSSGQVWLNTSGHPAMATGGMGDVLTGALAGLIGQGVAPGSAAVAAVYLHGLAGELAAASLGGLGILASEVADLLPAAVKKVRTGCRATQS